MSRCCGAVSVGLGALLVEEPDMCYVEDIAQLSRAVNDDGGVTVVADGHALAVVVLPHVFEVEFELLEIFVDVCLDEVVVKSGCVLHGLLIFL